MAQSITITGVKARQIYDSRGNPTVEVDITTQQGQFRAAVPSGASTGIYEALELRDKDPEQWHGKGVQTAVKNVNEEISKVIIGMDPCKQKEIDEAMLKLDGSDSKKNLGANAILGVSLAVARAGAAKKGLPLYAWIGELAGNKKFVLPVPAFNIINGGSHAGNALPVQEFMILPVGAASFSEAMQIGAEVYQSLKKVLKKKYGQDAVNVGDEGGFAPNIQSAKEALEAIQEAIPEKYKNKIRFGTDAAASEFATKDGDGDDAKFSYDFYKWDQKAKDEKKEETKAMNSDELSEVYKTWCKDFDFCSVEDSHDQDDWIGWAKLTAEIGDKIQIVGDDLLVTNPKRIQRAIDQKSCNALLLKVNQIGSLTEAIDAVKLAKKAGWGVMTSHRSGETEDTFIADLAVGLATGQIKTGAPCRSERLAKYNQLLRIEEELGGNAEYAGKNFRKPCEPY